MGVPVWLLGSGAGLIGLALGFWWGEAEREKLRKSLAAQDEAEQEREAVIERKEQALAEKAREAERKAQKLAEQLQTLCEQEKADHQEPISSPKKAPKKVAKGAKTKPGKAQQEEL